MPTRNKNIEIAVIRPAAKPQPRLSFTPLDEIVERDQEWLWGRRIPLGNMTILGGREGVGKSIVACDLAAKVTRGTLPGTLFGTPRGVIIAAYEDSWATTIKGRLRAAGVDERLCARVDVTAAGKAGNLTLPADLQELIHGMKERNAALLILDPLLTRLDAKLDTHKFADVQRALDPLVTAAAALDAAILGLIHHNKRDDADWLTCFIGSRAFVTVPRSVIGVRPDPSDTRCRLLEVHKVNLDAPDIPAKRFRIISTPLTDEHKVAAPRLEWLEDIAHTGPTALDSPCAMLRDQSEVERAVAWLTDVLNSHGGRGESAMLKREGRLAGFSEKVLQKAAGRMGVIYTPAGFPCKTYWSLPLHGDAARPQSRPNRTNLAMAGIPPRLHKGGPFESSMVSGAETGTSPRVGLCLRPSMAVAGD